jgi:uncharacterized protein
MPLAWDEDKRRANLAAHGSGFVGVEAIFDGPVLAQEDGRHACGEQRINLIGWLHGRVMHLTYTDDGETLHVISLCEADKHEIRRYQEEVLAR